MKICQTCNRTYDDDTLSFCLHDGSILIPGSGDPQATQRIPVPPSTEPYASNPVRPAHAQQSPPPTLQSPQLQYGAWATPQKSGNGKMWLAIGGIAAVLLLVIGVGAGIVLSRGDWFGGNDSNARPSNNGRGNYRSYNRSGTPASTPQPTPTSTPTPDVPVAEKLGLVGKWGGTQNGQPATLTITSGEGNAFTGIKYQGDNQVSFTGWIDPSTRRMTIRETKLLKGIPYSKGKGWSLASETGILSADGRRMSGTGTDEYPRKAPYKWSYTKKK
jgi:hypothetical protein